MKIKLHTQYLKYAGFILVASLGFTSCSGKEPIGTGLWRFESTNQFEESVEKIKLSIEENGLKLIAEIPHTKGAETAGLNLRPTTVLLFGNPKVGTPLMQKNPEIGLDLPQRVLLYRDEDGSTKAVLNHPHWLHLRHEIRETAPFLKIKDKLKKIMQVADLKEAQKNHH